MRFSEIAIELDRLQKLADAEINLNKPYLAEDALRSAVGLASRKADRRILETRMAFVDWLKTKNN